MAIENDGDRRQCMVIKYDGDRRLYINKSTTFLSFFYQNQDLFLFDIRIIFITSDIFSTSSSNHFICHLKDKVEPHAGNDL